VTGHVAEGFQRVINYCLCCVTSLSEDNVITQFLRLFPESIQLSLKKDQCVRNGFRNYIIKHVMGIKVAHIPLTRELCATSNVVVHAVISHADKNLASIA
jgi:hypothetical protein